MASTLNTLTTLNCRAKDTQIKYLTAISLDIDPIRKKGIPSTAAQRERAVRFALYHYWGLKYQMPMHHNDILK